MNPGLHVLKEEVIKENRELNIIFFNPRFSYRNIYIALYYALKSNKTFLNLNFGGDRSEVKLFISR